MTRADLIKIVVAAVVGGAITYVVGPLLKREIDRRTSGSHWAGEWQTVTCNPDRTFVGWTIEFDQDGDTVTGRYVGVDEFIKDARGTLAGKVNGKHLNGDWSQHSLRDVLGGTFRFSMYEDGDAFEGTYLLGETQALWFGRRDGRQPNCSTG